MTHSAPARLARLRPTADLVRERDVHTAGARREAGFDRGAYDSLKWLVEGGPGPLTGELVGLPLPAAVIVRELAAAEAVLSTSPGRCHGYAAGRTGSPDVGGDGDVRAAARRVPGKRGQGNPARSAWAGGRGVTVGRIWRGAACRCSGRSSGTDHAEATRTTYASKRLRDTSSDVSSRRATTRRTSRRVTIPTSLPSSTIGTDRSRASSMSATTSARSSSGRMAAGAGVMTSPPSGPAQAAPPTRPGRPGRASGRPRLRSP